MCVCGGRGVSGCWGTASLGEGGGLEGEFGIVGIRILLFILIIYAGNHL